MLADVIEHLVDPAFVLKKLRKMLTKNGRIVFSIPNMAHISIRLSLLEGKFEHTETGLIDKTHLHFYTKSEIERLFYEAGYEINNFKYTYASYPENLIKNRLEKNGLKFIGKNKSQLFESVESQAFQFVGSAKPSQKKKQHIPIKDLPHLKDSRQLDKIIKGLTAQAETSGSLKIELDSQIREVQRLQQQENRTGHRIVRKIYQAIDSIMGRAKQ